MNNNKPGRKATIRRRHYLLNGQMYIQRGRPTLEVLQNRLSVDLLKDEEYDPGKHVAYRAPEDILKCEQEAAKIASFVPNQENAVVAA